MCEEIQERNWVDPLFCSTWDMAFIMKVTLISYTQNAESVVAAAAKICYSPVGIDDIFQDLDNEKSADFVKMLASFGHESPTEHVIFTFGIEGVSRSFLTQITRHRIASYSVQSQRYVEENGFEHITPPEIENDPEVLEIFKEQMEHCKQVYNKIAEKLRNKHYDRLIAQGNDKKTAISSAQKMAIEDARFVLPNACETKMIVTFNARSLNNFFRLRLCRRAQWEIRRVAEAMYDIVLKTAPSLFEKAGSPCAFGKCPEGKMSCGEAESMRAKYSHKKERSL